MPRPFQYPFPGDSPVIDILDLGLPKMGRFANLCFYTCKECPETIAIIKLWDFLKRMLAYVMFNLDMLGAH